MQPVFYTTSSNRGTSCTTQTTKTLIKSDFSPQLVANSETKRMIKPEMRTMVLTQLKPPAKKQPNSSELLPRDDTEGEASAENDWERFTR